MTLDDLIEKPTTDIPASIKALAGFLKDQDNQSEEKFLKTQENIAIKMDEICLLLQKLCDRPDPTYPEPQELPDVQRVSMDAPEWYVPQGEPDFSWVPNMTNSIRYDGDKTREVLTMILDKLSEEKPEEESTPEPKTVNSAAVRSRRTTQWKRFDNYNLNNIISKGDGQTYFLPDSLIPNSETIRLNGGLPLSNNDYTLTGNKVFFALVQTNPQIEIRGQVK